jgi:putative membrane protein
MRTLLFAGAITLLATAAFADPQAAQPGPNNAAVKDPNANMSAMPVKGSNSFTAGQARSRIAAKGYSHISALHKDANGVWRGKARRHGHTVAVSVDFEGNVNPI